MAKRSLVITFLKQEAGLFVAEVKICEIFAFFSAENYSFNVYIYDLETVLRDIHLNML